MLEMPDSGQPGLEVWNQTRQSRLGGGDLLPSAKRNDGRWPQRRINSASSRLGGAWQLALGEKPLGKAGMDGWMG